MIEMRLQLADVARIRLARSPVQETLGSLAALSDRTRQPVHRRWLSTLPPALAPLDLRLLPALTSRAALPDFLFPVPQRRHGEFAEEVERVRAADPEPVRADLAEVFGSRLPAALRPLREDPERVLADVADELTRYHAALIEPIWQRLATVLDCELEHHGRRLADGGLLALFSGLSRRSGYRADRADRVELDFPHYSCSHDLAGEGLVLVPSAFVWPRLNLVPPTRAVPMISFPAAGVDRLWDDLPARPPARDTTDLEELLGRSRARMLGLLGTPMTTTQLARRLGLSVPATSLQLSILRRNRLVVARRAGREVFYHRTHLAATLLDAVVGPPAHDTALSDRPA